MLSIKKFAEGMEPKRELKISDKINYTDYVCLKEYCYSMWRTYGMYMSLFGLTGLMLESVFSKLFYLNVPNIMRMFAELGAAGFQISVVILFMTIIVNLAKALAQGYVPFINRIKKDLVTGSLCVVGLFAIYAIGLYFMVEATVPLSECLHAAVEYFITNATAPPITGW